MIDFFNDFDKVNEKENPKPETAKKQTEIEKAEEKAEEKEDTNEFSKTLESLRNEITALKELMKNSSKGSTDDENKKESEDVKE
jgi:hypothetical protein